MPAEAATLVDNAHLLVVDDDARLRALLQRYLAEQGFRVSIGLTSSEKWIVIAAGDHVTSEAWLLPADDPLAKPVLVSARQAGREYDVDQHEGTLYIRTNDTHPNFRLVKAALATPDSSDNATVMASATSGA